MPPTSKNQPTSSQWQCLPAPNLPHDFVESLRPFAKGKAVHWAATLLWQRGIRNPQQLPGYLDPQYYHPTPAFAFGEEMAAAIARLEMAYHRREKLAIWGDFDADGITATAVLWEGLGQWFPQGDRLCYYIPNRLYESHGLATAGLATLADQGVTLVITCDTGSTNQAEIATAANLGLEIIVTDHHTLPLERPPVVAIVNPRSLPPHHPLASLSGVAVAYKLMEAFAEAFPLPMMQPPTTLLDLVAIGLIADLVELRDDARYLAQIGIQHLQHTQRPGLLKLLELCKKQGDRPTDIAFGLGPRINAVSRIQGDARFCVDLLTSRDPAHCDRLAWETELANSRRKALQRDVALQVRRRLERLDRSTTPCIVLSDPQWPVGILGLVAAQIAQEFYCPVILLQGDSDQPGQLLRGSARSIAGLDLYQVMATQSHLLQSFGGHPLAAGLSLLAENLSLFRESVHQVLRQINGTGHLRQPVLTIDLTVTVADLGKDLFWQLKLLEPYGIGNPTPRLLVLNCWFAKIWHRNLQDGGGRKLQYIKTDFQICDDSAPAGFPGVWWEHSRDQLPLERCDAVVELDFNAARNQYFVRLIDVRRCSCDQMVSTAPALTPDWLWDWRGYDIAPDRLPEPAPWQVERCPTSWADWHRLCAQARQQGVPVAIVCQTPNFASPEQVWRQWVGIARHLSRTGRSVTLEQLQQKLGISDRALQHGLSLLPQLGFHLSHEGSVLQLTLPECAGSSIAPTAPQSLQDFLQLLQEEYFYQQYFCRAPIAVLAAMATDRDTDDITGLSFTIPANHRHRHD